MTDRAASIVIVDDESANLALMQDLLAEEGFDVRVFSAAAEALAGIEERLPDLILLDITMPEMDGFQVCERLKRGALTAAIPIIFLTALYDTEVKVRAFRAGAADYITKPFEAEEVLARVGVQHALQQARRAERELLEKTLTGAVKAFSELMQLAEPSLFARSDAIRGAVLHIVSKLGLPEPWLFELASSLCLIGCLTLPGDTFSRIYAGELASGHEEEAFRAHPRNGSRLISNIPRLETVAEMICGQQTAFEEPVSPDAELGARILHVAVQLDRSLVRRMPLKAALEKMRASLPASAAPLVDALRDYAPPELPAQIRSLRLADIRPTMLLQENAMSTDGRLCVLQAGTVLSPTLLERLRNFDATRGVRQPIRVLIP